jgi:hypothetical protein
MDGQLSDGIEPDDRLPITVLGLSLHWNVTKEKLLQIKCALVQQKSGWENLHSCGTDQLYLPGLSSEKKMTKLKKMAEGLIEPFLKNYIQILFPKVNNFKVGAICSKGGICNMI